MDKTARIRELNDAFRKSFIGGNGSSATNCSSSDQRLKDDITSLDASSSLSAIRELNPVSFKWNAWMVGNPLACLVPCAIRLF